MEETKEEHFMKKHRT